MPTWRIPARWMMERVYEINADTIEKAIDIVEVSDEFQPEGGEYCPDTYFVPPDYAMLLNGIRPMVLVTHEGDRAAITGEDADDSLTPEDDQE